MRTLLALTSKILTANQKYLKLY